MSEQFNLEIVSPEKSFLKKDNVTEVIVPAFEGEMGILKDHISLITFLRPGILRLIDDKDRRFFVAEGTVEFSNNNLLILTSSAKEISEIDKDSLNSLISEAEQKIVDDKITDKEKYLLSYKIDTLKNINQ